MVAMYKKLVLLESIVVIALLIFVESYLHAGFHTLVSAWWISLLDKSSV